ncbi:Ig-like domain-containing protein [Dysgonomonas sp. 520]|uniref:Ig-like domain-containing protein n=1 Tax=Dysgonomonas sp. 520 TaxID=2302931 RepID=UPI0013D3BF1E|nr:Ig-like domain-containing protein [Dysgonomonas sp. 520]NDW09974.1 hypothetical protein [Dysgonomonas sp. 520]
MKKYILFSIAFLFFVGGGRLFAQQATSASTEGTDFWVSFGANGSATSNNLGGAADPNLTLQIRIVASKAVTGTITFTQTNTTESFSVPAGGVFTRDLSATERPLAYSATTGSSNKSIRIQSSGPVSVYALHQYWAAADATNILPVSRLSTRYYQVSYASNINAAAYHDGYTVIATENNTAIYENKILKATLQKGQVYSYYATSNTIDLTGRYITASKPIAHFVTNTLAFIPKGKAAGDILYQQLMPIDAWGNKFLVPVSLRKIERVRIMASQNNTVITQVGGTIKTDGGGSSSLTLNAGKFVELDVTSSTNGCYISSNKPIAVCSYFVGNVYAKETGGYVSGDTPDKKGDPAEAWIPPFEQSIESTTIAPFIPTGATQLREHYALIVTPTASKNETKVALGSGALQSLTGGTWADNVASGHSYYSLPLTAGGETSYTFSNPAGLIVLGYGLGSDESYYYLAGSAARDLVPAFYVNNIHFQDIDGQEICDAPYTIKGLIDESDISTAPGHVRWSLDGVEQTTVQDQLLWSIPNLSNGEHTITMRVVSSSGTEKLLTTTFKVNCVVETVDAVDDYTSTSSGAISSLPVKIDILANDDLGSCGVSNISLSLDNSALPQHGTVTIDANKKLIYTPALGYEGIDAFRYIIDCNGVSDVATVYVVVTKIPDNITPEAQDVCIGEAKAMIFNFSLMNGAYQWQISFDNSTWSDITGATSKNYTITDQKVGVVYYRAIVSNGAQTVTSQSARVKINSCILPVNHNISVMKY